MYNLDFDWEKWMKQEEADYVAYGAEVCPTTGRHHQQAFMHFKSQRTINVARLAKTLEKHHVEPMYGSIGQNEDYCSKENNGELVEFGKKPEQGKRTDIEAVRDRIMKGQATVDEITVENPEMFHQYGRTMTRLEDIALRKRFRTQMTEGVWYVGPTGVGKSHRVFDGYNPETHYLWKLNDNGWQDGYCGQPIVIMNDFRGEIKYNEMLQLIDKWPFTVPRRGREPAPFLAERVLITSSLTPEQVYNRRAEEDSLAQLSRRISVVEIGSGDPGSEVVGGNTDPDLEAKSETETRSSQMCAAYYDDEHW